MPSTGNHDCFEDEDEDEDEDDKDGHGIDYECINGNGKVTGLSIARSSCTDDILLKTLIAKYTKRLMAKLEKVAVKVPNDSEHADAVERLRKKFQRLIKEMEKVGGPGDSSTVLLNKYDCLRMAFYSVLEGIKGKKKPLSNQGVSAATEKSENLKFCEKVRQRKEAENRKKLENQKKSNNNENHEKRVNYVNNEKLENRENNEKLEKQQNSENIEKLKEQENHENNEKLENLKKIENLKNLENIPNLNFEKRVTCEFCGKRTKNCDMTWETNLRSDKDNIRKEPFELKSFLKNRFFIYFPCLCCMFGKSD